MAPRATPLRITFVVPVAFVAAILTFTGVVAFLRLSSEHEPEADVGRTLLFVLGFLAVLEIPIYLLVRKQLLARARAAKDEGLELLRQDLVPQPLFLLLVVGAAMVEGLGLLGLIAVQFGAPLYGLAAPALAVLLILAQFPTRERLENVVRGG